MVRLSRAAYHARWRADNPGRSAAYSRRYHLRQYGLTPEEFEAMNRRQGGLCAACGEPETTRDRTGRVRLNLSVDHSHETGKVRGLLCHHCNAILGLSRDDIVRLEAVMAYARQTW